jgi:hypothetical protein
MTLAQSPGHGGRGRTVLVLVAVAVVVLGLGSVLLLASGWHPGGDTANGTGLTYQDRFYWASGAQVRDDALGATVAEAVPFQDTTADLRAIAGLDPATTLAAWLPSLDGSPGGPRWTLVSTDQDRGTNPAGYDDTRVVLVP